MAGLTHPVTWLVNTLRRWPRHERQVVIERLVDDYATTQPSAQHRALESAHDDRASDCRCSARR